MKTTKALLSFLICVAMFILLNRPLGSVPPLGKFLDPFSGFWQNAEGDSQDNAELKLKYIRQRTEILFDTHQIPHIFAKNEYDLYFAQGYITAKDRLWQMDFQSRFAAGRLSEVIGDKALELDRYQRRMGMVYGAEQMVKELEKHPKIKAMVQAYADGINAWIHQLSARNYPLEFKILDYKPEKWTTLNTALLLKLMSATLAGGSDEFYMNNVLKKFGHKTTQDLFPDYPTRNEPIIPTGTPWNFKTPPGPSLHTPLKVSSSVTTRQRDEGTGSNNWALAGGRTASGFPLLANDPHLDLTLPSIWYQTQLTAPNVNVYGVTIPGAPGIVIGFNQKAAWGVTNVGADVLDWYRIKFRDSTYQYYWHDKRWKKVRRRVEAIKVRGQGIVVDTVYYTHHGPVVYLQKPDFSKSNNIPIGHALRWVAHNPSADLATFYHLNRASSYQDYRDALSMYTAPAQNFVFASSENDIAITSNGYFPLRTSRQGKFLLDGTNAEYDWKGRIPFKHYPSILNPKRAFVSSANQNPTDKAYPYYLNWEFAGYERAHRINSRLEGMKKATPDSMRILQNDNYSVLARDVLPTLVSLVNTDKLNATGREAYNIVSTWGYHYDAAEIGASIFELWQKLIYEKIWADEFTDNKLPMRFPNRDRTVQLLLNEPNAKWFDNSKTPNQESRKDIVNAAFKFAVDSLSRKFGPLGKSWQWGNVKPTRVSHLAKIPGLGSGVLFMGGSKQAINALNESNGPSWRMVVALGKKKNRGFGIFPGGQSGNPGSFHYDDLIVAWTKGRLNELLFLESPSKKHSKITNRIILKN